MHEEAAGTADTRIDAPHLARVVVQRGEHFTLIAPGAEDGTFDLPQLPRARPTSWCCPSMAPGIANLGPVAEFEGITAGEWSACAEAQPTPREPAVGFACTAIDVIANKDLAAHDLEIAPLSDARSEG